MVLALAFVCSALLWGRMDAGGGGHVWLVECVHAFWPLLFIPWPMREWGKNCAWNLSRTTTPHFSSTMTVCVCVCYCCHCLFVGPNISSHSAWYRSRVYIFKPISSAFIYFNITPLISGIICGNFLAHQLQFVIRISTPIPSKSTLSRAHTFCSCASSNCLDHFKDRCRTVDTILLYCWRWCSYYLFVCSFGFFIADSSRRRKQKLSMNIEHRKEITHSIIPD